MTTPSSNVGADASRGHTPGPWTVDLEDYGIMDNMTPYVVVENGAVAVARVPNRYLSNDLPLEANARLIAAAPDMLTLIEDIEQSLTADDTYRLLREACRKVIAKALPTTPAGETK